MSRRPTAVLTKALLPLAFLLPASSVLAVLGPGWNAPAAAHISLLSSDPADGQRLGRVPEQLRLEFSEPVSAPAYVALTAPDGTRTSQGEVRIAGSTVVADLPPGPDGTYSLAFRVVSRDGHPVSGRITFVVGDGPLGDPGASGSAASDAPTAGESASVAHPPPRTDGAGLSEGEVQVGGAVVLFALAGLLLLLSGPGPIGRRPETGASAPATPRAPTADGTA